MNLARSYTHENSKIYNQSHTNSSINALKQLLKGLKTTIAAMTMTKIKIKVTAIKMRTLMTQIAMGSEYHDSRQS